MVQLRKGTKGNNMKMNLREFAEDKGYTIKDESDLEQEYKDFIDEFNEVKIMGMSYCASRVLEELDPTAFRCGFNDWLDSEQWDEFEGDYMQRSDIEQVEEEFEEYENEEEEE